MQDLAPENAAELTAQAFALADATQVKDTRQVLTQKRLAVTAAGIVAAGQWNVQQATEGE